jgi:hypothetical protein
LIPAFTYPWQRNISRYTMFGKLDGAAGALQATPNFPALLTPYGASRPPWNVAGVDYYVGANPNIQLQDWRTLTRADLTVNVSQGLVQCSAANTRIENIDFSTGFGGVLRNPSGAATTLVVNNCKFQTPLPDALWMNASGSPILEVNSASPCNLTVTNCSFNSTDGTPRQLGSDDIVDFIFCEGSLIAKYNFFYHPNQSVITMGGVAGVSSYGLTYQYNLIYNHYLTSNAHRNEVQWVQAPSSSLLASTVSFNTSFQDYHSTMSGPSTFTIAAPAVFTWQGTAGNPFVNGMPCLLTGGTIPGGFVINTRYWVVNQSGNNFSLSSTYGGTGITSTGSPGTTQTSLTFFGGGEGVQFNFAVGSIPFSNMNFNNNTFIARRVYQTQTSTNTPVSTWVDGSFNTVTNSFNKQNYFDPTGAAQVYYPGTFPTPGWTNSGNIDMTTNQIITPT